MTCPTKFCRNPPTPGRKTCNKCRTAADRSRYPMRAAYHSTKNCARARGIPFKVTLAEFAEFATRVKLLTGRGRTRDKWHVDRIDNSRGYEAGNLQLLTCSKNSSKGALSKGLSAIYRHRCQLLEMGFPSTELAGIYRPLVAEEIQQHHIIHYDYQTRQGLTIKINRHELDEMEANAPDFEEPPF